MVQWSTAQALSSIADAANATSRLYGVFEAELLEKTHTVDPSLDVAIDVKRASFTWDSPLPDADTGKDTSGGRKMLPAKSKAKVQAVPAAEKKWTDHLDEKAFKVRDVNMSVSRGQLVAIVGSVGSGKSSLLQGLIGEMRKTRGSIVFGGSVGYCPQSAWIQVCSSLGYG